MKAPARKKECVLKASMGAVAERRIPGMLTAAEINFFGFGDF